MTAKTPVRCAIYTRKSTEEGLELSFNSLHAQREACEAYVKSQAGEGWVVLKQAYDDGGFSGGSMTRPALERLMSDVDQGLIDIIVVYKIDRLTRSLADFAKIVERLEARGASFVSVTQAFNTTTSMGRLTLNVLLSFAQFEREVAGERIRDKVAASRAKGLWMGGSVPTGYDLKDKKLYPSPVEAEAVRFIFKRYLELRSVRDLMNDLRARNIVSKERVSPSGKVTGGTPFGRGALACLLRNRVYVGEAVHKGTAHPGQHEAIVPSDLFADVQALMAQQTRTKQGMSKTALESPLTGLIFDDRGNRMSPGHSQKNGRTRYRYYVSAALHEGRRDRAGSIPRVPAQPIEDLVASRLHGLGVIPDGSLSQFVASVSGEPSSGTRLGDVMRRVEIGASTIRIDLSRDELQGIHARGSASLSDDELRERLRSHAVSVDQAASVDQFEVAGDAVVITIPIKAQFRGGSAEVASAVRTPFKQRSPRVDRAIAKAVVRAHTWLASLLAGDVSSVDELAAREGQDRRYVRRILRLAFLPPDLTEAFLEGTQSPHLTVSELIEADLPLDWAEQRRLLGAPSP
jgi:DNA invertase Pin-like site-specific DNA recombinase